MWRPILFLGIIRWIASSRIRSGCRSNSFQAASSLLPAWIPGVSLIELLVPLVTGEHNLFDVGDDHVVAGVDVGRVRGPVFAHQNRRDLRREPTDNLGVGVDHIPVLDQFARFGLIAIHGEVCLHPEPNTVANSPLGRNVDGTIVKNPVKRNLQHTRTHGLVKKPGSGTDWLTGL